MQPGGVHEHVLSRDQAMGGEKRVCSESVHKLNFPQNQSSRVEEKNV